jgi:hypothetical protein
VLFNEIPPFDLLTSQKLPYEGFGHIIDKDKLSRDRFFEVLEESQSRVAEIFNVTLAEGRNTVRILEEIITQMWDQGWDPATNDINLFTRDFGVLLAHSLHETLNGKLIFRSEVDLSHMSLHWKSKAIETFPFHKTFKRMSFRDGESIIFFFDGLDKIINS